jgi:hypothetical protein
VTGYVRLDSEHRGHERYTALGQQLVDVGLPTVAYLDPAAVPIGPGEWLLVISVAEGDPIEGTHELVVTRLLRTTG